VKLARSQLFICIRPAAQQLVARTPCHRSLSLREEAFAFCVRSAVSLNSKINIDRERARAFGSTGNNTSTHTFKYIFTFAVANIHAEIIRANLSVDQETESARQPAGAAAAAAVVQLVLQLARVASVLALWNRVADQST
jgi:hypothetical protein